MYLHTFRTRGVEGTDKTVGSRDDLQTKFVRTPTSRGHVEIQTWKFSSLDHFVCSSSHLAHLTISTDAVKVVDGALYPPPLLP